MGRILALAVALGACTAGCARNELIVTKPGVSPEQMDRDTRQCETNAQRAADAQVRSATDRTRAYNRILVLCLRGRGYEIVDPAAVDKP